MVDDRERQRIREYWLELSRKYEAGDLTRAEFCRQEKISTATFDNWRTVFSKEGLTETMQRKKQKARGKGKQTKPQANALVPVVITQTAESRQAIEIRTARGHVVMVPVSVNPTMLREVFRALGDL